MDIRKINLFWQKATLLIAPPLLTVLIWLKPTMDPFQWLLWLHLPFLMFHEAEEYVLSPIHFKEYFNLKTPFGSGTDPNFPADEFYIFQVNILLLWPLITLGAILASFAPWVGFSLIWFELILNNIMHTLVFPGEKLSYTPGLLTNSFLLLPYGTWTLICAAKFFTWSDWLLSVLLAVVILIPLFAKTLGRLARLRRGEIPRNP